MLARTKNPIVTYFSGIVLVMATLLVVIGFAAPVRAIDTSVDTTDVSFIGMVQALPVDTYDVYVRLALRGQTAQVTVGQVGSRTMIGSVEASGDFWQKVGMLQATQAESIVSLQLNSQQLSNEIDANRPMVLLVSHTHPACIPDSECKVMIDSRPGTVIPPSNSSIHDTLRISRVITPASDTVTRVTYYLDNEPIYSTKTYQPFDLRYVLYDQQKAVSVIEYSSGQKVVLGETIPEGYKASIWSILFRGFQRNAGLYLSVFAIIGIIAVAFISLGTVRVIERRHAWRRAHGFIAAKQQAAVSEIEQQRKRLFARIRLWMKRIVAACFVVLIAYGLLVATNTYLLTITRVDGVSMESTYDNGAGLVVNRVPVTLARLAGRSYVPTRGQAVILRAVYGVVDPQTSREDGQETILKRVLGLPGERVVVDNGTVTVYKADGTSIHPDDGAPWSKTMHRAADRSHIDITLDNDEVFVSGDNRPLSIDSRVNGPISTSQITGIVLMKL